MLYSLAAAAFVALASAASAPDAPSDSSCKASYDGTFEIEVLNVTMAKRGLVKRDALMLTLEDGILKDALGRIGYIAANSQFQFDKMAQPGSPYDAGWAVCGNGSLVLGPYATFEECLSGDFYNLYLNNGAGQCSDVYIEVIKGSMGSPVDQQGDGQPTFIPVTQISDGQPQVSTAAIVTQISDGQPQGPMMTGAPVSQISDGQIQVSTGGAPVSQISDGQIQVSTGGAPVTQISDGQIQVTTGKPMVTSPPKVSQIGDGQPQVPTKGGNSTRPATTSVVPYTGDATIVRGGLFGLVAGVLAIAML